MKLLRFGGAMQAACIALLIGSLSCFVQAANAEQRLTKVADGVYYYVDTRNASPQKSFGANAGIVIGRDGVVVVDTLISAKEAKRFIRDIRSITDKPIKYVVDTHAHLDHTFGNAEFEKLGAVIIAHSADAKQMRASSEAVLKGAAAYGLTDEDVEGTKVVYPTLTFSDKMGIDMGDEEIELIYPGASHTGGSIIVLLPGKKVLFAGDILFTDYHPFIADGDIDSWVAAIDKILAMDVTTIVSGHGPISGKKDLREMRDYLIAFDKYAKALCAKSDNADLIVSEIRKVLPSRPEGGSLIKANIQMKYLRKGP